MLKDLTVELIYSYIKSISQVQQEKQKNNWGQ